MQSKFNIGQTVYIVNGTDLISGEIGIIQIDKSGASIFIDSYDDPFPQDTVFSDKIDAVTYWLQVNGIEVKADVELLKTKVNVALQHI